MPHVHRQGGRAPGLPREPMNAVLQLQRTAGNAAVHELLRRYRDRPEGHSRDARRAIQRHPEGAALVEGAEMAAEVGDKANRAPSATRTKEQESKDKADATGEGQKVKAAQKLSPGAMSLSSAQTILKGAYGGVKTIVTGTIVILADQPACAAKYDEVCMADKVPRPDGSAWKAGDCAKDDKAAGVQTEGFAWKGTVYVNGATTLITATAHEMLHLNTGSNFRAKMGETFNEGMTEFFARKAIAAAGVPVPGVTAYPVQVDLARTLAALVGEDVAQQAYFGDAMELIRMYLRKGSGTWDKLRAAAEALDVDKAKNYMKPKS